MKLVIYSLKEVNGKYTVTIELSSLIRSIVHNKEIMIDAPVTGLKRFSWYPYIQKQHVFDNGHVFFMVCEYKKISMKFALQHLIQYKNTGRKNAKDYSKV